VGPEESHGEFSSRRNIRADWGEPPPDELWDENCPASLWFS